MASNMSPSADQYGQAMPTRRYKIREKFKIKDETGQDVYTFRSKIFSVGDKLILEDMAGK
jgi:uncharacterized protein YxjI